MPPSLYEVLEVSNTATSAEIRRAYKNKALKVHPDRVPAEQKQQAQVEFQKLGAAYEILSNDTMRREYDLTGRIPAGPEPSSSSRPNTRDAFTHSFSFGSDNDHSHPFVGGFNAFNTFNNVFGSFGMRDPFADDPFFNPQLRNRERDQGRRNNTFDFYGRMAGEHFADQAHDSGRTRMFSTSFGFGNQPNQPQTNGGGLFGNVFGALGASMSGHGSLSGSWSTSIGGSSNGNSNFSSSFSSSTRSVYRNGQWVSETTESKTVNGETKTQTKRAWTDEHGVEHIEYKYGDGSRRYIRGGVEQNVAALPPIPPTSSSSRRNGN